MERTELNAVERFPADAPLDQLLAAIERDGACIVEEMIPVDVINEARAAADTRSHDFEPGAATQGMGEEGKAFVGANTVRFSSLATLSPAFFEVLDNDVFHSIAEEILLPHCGSYWLNTAQVMYIGPGEPAQVLHRDADNWWEYVEGTWPNSNEITISAMIALEDVTEELGATRVVPGSQQAQDLSLYADGESVPAELGPGDALVYSGYVFHGGGANMTSDRWRRAMHMSVVAGWLTPEEASPLDFALGELADQSPRLQRMLGHRSYEPGPRRGGGLWLRHVRAIEDSD